MSNELVENRIEPNNEDTINPIAEQVIAPLEEIVNSIATTDSEGNAQTWNNDAANIPAEGNSSGDNATSNAATTSPQQPQQLPGRIPIRINVRNRSGRPLPTPRIHVDGNGQMHVSIGQIVNMQPQLNANAAVNVAASGSPHTPYGRRIQLKPLEPEPIEYNAPSPLDGDQWSKYKCIISMELLESPVGCGNCASRFSHACLQRYVNDFQQNQQQQRRNSPHQRERPKCPACRVEMTKGLVPDRELEEEMKTCGPVACRFEGCPAQLVLSEIREHEKTCAHSMVKCRYSQFGCAWKGKRGDLRHHEVAHCSYTKVSGLVHQFRLLAATNSVRIDAMEQQNGLNQRLEAARQQNLQRAQRVCKTNLFALMEYCHLITCNTAHVIFSQERWAPYFLTDEGRALVTNSCALAPLGILFGCTSLGGIREILRLVEFSQDNEPNKPYLLADSVLALCMGLLGMLMFAANFSDVRSSKSWHRFDLGATLGQAPVIGDVMALSAFTILESAFEVLNVGLFKCLFLWWLLTLCTAFYPIVILTLSESIPRSQRQIPLSARQVLSRARAMEPLLFGLRYSLLGFLFGPIPCLDAAVAINLLHAGPRTDPFRMRNSFLGGTWLIEKSACAAFFGAQIAILFGTNYGHWSEAVFNSVLAMICLPLINYIDHKLFSLAIKTGRKIYDQSFAMVQGTPHGPDRDYNFLGLAVFGSWVCTLLMISQF